MSIDLSNKRPIFVSLIFLMVLGVVFLFLPSQIARAYTLPGLSGSQLLTTAVPSILDFEFVVQPGSRLTIVDAVLLQCELSDCQDAKSLDEISSQKFSCTGNHCSSAAYFGYLRYFRLRITFSDGKIRESNVFSKATFNANFRVQVRESDLRVEEKQKPTTEPTPTMEPDLLVEEKKEPTHKGPSLGGLFTSMGLLLVVFGCFTGIPLIGLLIVLGMLVERAGRDRLNFSASRIPILISWFLCVILLAEGALLTIAVPVTVVVEVVLVIIYAVIRHKDKIVLATSTLIGNTITLLAVWFTFLAMDRGFPIYAILIAVIFIWLVEALVYFLMNRKETPFGEVLFLSLILNGITFLILLILP